MHGPGVKGGPRLTDYESWIGRRFCESVDHIPTLAQTWKVTFLQSLASQLHDESVSLDKHVLSNILLVLFFLPLAISLKILLRAPGQETAKNPLETGPI